MKYGAAILEKEYDNPKSENYKNLDKILIKHPELTRDQLISMLKDAGADI